MPPGRAPGRPPGRPPGSISPGRKSGQPPKSDTLTHNTSKKGAHKVTDRELKKLERTARLEEARLEKDRKHAEKEVEKMTLDLIRLRKVAGLPDDAFDQQFPSIAPQPTPPPSPVDEAQSVYQLVSDMRALYKTLGGQRKLKEFVQESPKNMEFFMKQMIGLEMAVKAMEIKNAGLERDGAVFVIIKGLEDERDVKRQIAEATKNGKASAGQSNGAPEREAVDLRQIAAAISPDNTVTIEEGDEDETEGWGDTLSGNGMDTGNEDDTDAETDMGDGGDGGKGSGVGTIDQAPQSFARGTSAVKDVEDGW